MAVVAIAGAIIAALAAWGIFRLRAGRASVQRSLAQAGYDAALLRRRIIRRGPFRWTTTPSQIVFRVRVHSADGRQRSGWARWGRRWLFDRDALELRWDDSDDRSS